LAIGPELQSLETEQIVQLHEQSMQLIAANVEPEEALRYYRMSFVFLKDMLAYCRIGPEHAACNEPGIELLRDYLFQQHTVQAVTNKFENVLQHMDCGIMLFDNEGFITFVNVMMARFLGVSRKSLVGLDMAQLAEHTGLTHPFRKLIVKLNREMAHYRLRYHEVTDGHGHHYLISVTYGEELNGDMLISIKDITEYKKIEHSAYQNDKLAMLGRIAAAIAHEIRNPLTSIRGFMQLLWPNLQALGKAEYAAIIMEEIDRANDIIYEFLNSSKPSTPDKKQIAVGTLLNDVKLLFESEAIMKGCDITLLPIDPSFTIFADLKQIKQVLLNIVKNSLDAVSGDLYMERGSIKMSAEPHHPREVMIIVEDNGTGMDFHTQSKLFDPFFTTKTEGTGLGLAVSYRIIKNHGGHIAVDSDIGCGTRFKISLPLS
jgi:PAS domain S-box-containing protein